MTLGILHLEPSQEGEWWIVSLPHHAKNYVHDVQIVAWCDEQFGYVDKGVIMPDKSQDFWFNQEHHAILCWLTWGS